MRDLDSARRSWQELKRYQSLRELKDAVRLDGQGSLATAGCRSICWKVFLLFDTLDLATWTRTLSSSRSAYNSLRSHFLRYLENADEVQPSYDPLGDDTEDSPWAQLREDEELRGEILQDVVRCMPENLYFRQPDTQRMLVDILFIFSKLNPDVSYRQGMHEILAPILWVVERDAIDLGQSSKTMGEDATIRAIFDAEHIEHDTFAIFGETMQSAKNFYEPTTTSGKENPMVARSQRIFNELLLRVDAKLAKHLQSIDIVPQVFLMRWIRLLFGREFAFDDLLTVWDVIFAEDSTLEIVDHICLAMILRIRWELIDADYNAALTLLLHYPDVEKDFSPQTFALDALYLQKHLDHHGGSYLVSKYTGNPFHHEGRPVTPPALQRNITAVAGPNKARSSGLLSPSRTARSARNIEAVLQSTAKNIYAGSERLGIGRAVRSAVDEVHKRAQEIRETQTPSAPVAWRQRGPEVLQNKIRALENRSMQLSNLLDRAVSDLWDFQKQIAEGPEGGEKTFDGSGVEQLSVAIAKVQFVQVYLNDPGLPLPDAADQNARMPESSDEGASALNEPSTSQDYFQAKGDVDAIAPAEHLIAEKETPLSGPPSSWTPKSQSIVDDLADPSTFEEFSEPLPKQEEKVPEIVFQSDTNDTAHGITPTEKGGQEGSRHRLEQSSLSWMLGDSETSSRAFGNALSSSAGSDRSKGLFGDGVGDSSTGSQERRGSGKQRGKPNKMVEDDEDGFDLSNLRHSRK